VNGPYESPVSRRLSIHRDPQATRIVVRAKRHILILLFLMFWLGAWTVGGLTAFSVVLSETGDDESRWFMIFWLCGWAVGWVAVACLLVWMAFGKEALEVNSRGLIKVLKAPYPLRKWRYDPAWLGAIHSHPAKPSGAFDNKLTALLPFGSYGTVQIDYGQSTIHFGALLDAAEANAIVAELERSFGHRRQET
jgi:hypothetical protein